MHSYRNQVTQGESHTMSEQQMKGLPAGNTLFRRLGRTIMTGGSTQAADRAQRESQGVK